MRLDSHIDDKIPHIYIINLIIKYNDDVSPLGIENNRSIFSLCKFVVNLLFFVVKSFILCGHVCDIRLSDWLPGGVASYIMLLVWPLQSEMK